MIFKPLIVLFLFSVLQVPVIADAQEWTPPVNISNIPGMDNMPDMCIDSCGNLHCVFTHKVGYYYGKIYYSHSEDNGLSWSTPEDVSLNTTLYAFNAHIVASGNNTLHLTYDYNLINPGATQVLYRYFDGEQWSDALNISSTQPGAHDNFPVLDHNQRLYCFWYWAGKSYYKYLENNTWSEVLSLYPEAYWWIFDAAVVDRNNNLQCIGDYLYEGQTITNIKVIYFQYLYEQDTWTDKTLLSRETYLGGGNQDIAISPQDISHITYLQRDYDTLLHNDTTMYSVQVDTNWSSPESIISGDPYEQHIVVDSENDAQIVDRENLETGTMLVHYQKINELWQGYVIDSAENLTGFPELLYYNNMLYLVYNKSDIPEITDIYLSKYDIVTDINEQTNKLMVDEFKLFPNPFTDETTLSFQLNKEGMTDIRVYNMSGQCINTLLHENLSPGTYKINWNGKDKNGKEVIPGQFLIRLQRGRQIISRAVNYIK